MIALEADDGIVGWGETNTGYPWGIERAFVTEWWAPKLIGHDSGSIAKIVANLNSDAPFWPHYNREGLSCAIEMALWDLYGRTLGVPISDLLGGGLRDQVQVAFCLGITEPRVAVDISQRLVASGISVLKTKLGFDLRGDLERVAAIVDATDGRLRLRLDANEGLGRIDATLVVNALGGMPIEYLEQPLPIGDFDGMAMLAARSRIPIAVNEDTYMPAGVFRAVRSAGVDAAVVDVEASGGVRGMVRLAAFAAEAHLPLAHHSAFDLGVKTALVLQITSALPAFSMAIDSTYDAHVDDVLVSKLTISGGSMAVPDGPGIGVDVDATKLAQYTVSEVEVKREAKNA